MQLGYKEIVITYPYPDNVLGHWKCKDVLCRNHADRDTRDNLLFNDNCNFDQKLANDSVMVLQNANSHVILLS